MLLSIKGILNLSILGVMVLLLILKYTVFRTFKAERTWHPNGKLKSRREYYGNSKSKRYHGLSVFYNENGVKIREENYQLNELHGVICIYNDEGKLLSTSMYEFGKETMHFDETKNLK